MSSSFSNYSEHLQTLLTLLKAPDFDLDATLLHIEQMKITCHPVGRFLDQESFHLPEYGYGEQSFPLTSYLTRLYHVRHLNSSFRSLLLNTDEAPSFTGFDQPALFELLKALLPLLNIDARDSRGHNALHDAAEVNDLLLAQFLLDQGASPTDYHAGVFTPLHMAAHRGQRDLMKLLLGRGFDVNLKARFHTMAEPPLIYALVNGDLTMMTLLHEHGAQIHFPTPEFRLEPPCHMALKLSYMSKPLQSELISWFLERGADPNAIDKNKMSLLHRAATADHLDVVELLVKHGATLGQLSGDGTQMTEVHMAAKNGNLPMLKFFLEQGCSHNARDIYGQTPLYLALQEQDDEMVNYLKGFDHAHIEKKALESIFTEAKIGGGLAADQEAHLKINFETHLETDDEALHADALSKPVKKPKSL